MDSSDARAPVPPPKADAPPSRPARPSWSLVMDRVELLGTSPLRVRFRCQTNIPSFHRPQYDNVERSYEELALYAAALALTSPSVIVPALPLPTPWLLRVPKIDDTNEDPELQHLLAHWFACVSGEMALCMHRETLRFVEADYSYEPLPLDDTAPVGLARQAARTQSYIQSLAKVLDGSLMYADDATGRAPMWRRTAPHDSPAALVPPLLASALPVTVTDPDETLAAARGEVTRLETQLGDVARASAAVTQARQGVDAALRDVMAKLPGLAMLEETRPLSARLQLPRTLRDAKAMLQDMAQLCEDQMYADQVTLGDVMEYHELSMRTVRQCLQERTAMVVESTLAHKVVATKQLEADQLQFAKTLRPDRVDAAVAEVREAQHHAGLLDKYLAQVSRAMRESLQRHSVQTHHDLQRVLREHVRLGAILDRRLAEMLARFDDETQQLTQEVDALVQRGERVRRKITPAQRAAAQMMGREVPPDDACSRAEDSTPAPAEDSTPAPAEDATPAPAEDAESAPVESEPAPAESEPAPAEPEPTPEPPSFPSMLFRRAAQNGRWGRLSASDAAKSLGGTF
ncbi:Vacuolar protein sorting-associated protein 17 [Malassezia caprae]|uniref:Vacuolar protein sorting-associated protein 17 n=1 Tax=Malassezia caprae TaxID=1381934 RepID=A0AAF0E3F3_9BASI|nr:Vacuolar protein sorting-associated protein 17 [Malassezia caprae]